MLESAPSLAPMPPPAPEDVVNTKKILNDIRTATAEDAPPGAQVRFSVAEMNSGMRLAARFWPGIRLKAELFRGDVHVTAALPVPFPGGPRWINGEAVVPPFEDRFRLTRLKLGGLSLPLSNKIQGLLALVMDAVHPFEEHLDQMIAGLELHLIHQAQQEGIPPRGLHLSQGEKF